MDKQQREEMANSRMCLLKGFNSITDSISYDETTECCEIEIVERYNGYKTTIKIEKDIS